MTWIVTVVHIASFLKKFYFVATRFYDRHPTNTRTNSLPVIATYA